MWKIKGKVEEFRKGQTLRMVYKNVAALYWISEYETTSHLVLLAVQFCLWLVLVLNLFTSHLRNFRNGVLCLDFMCVNSEAWLLLLYVFFSGKYFLFLTNICSSAIRQLLLVWSSESRSSTWHYEVHLQKRKTSFKYII